MSEVKDPAIKLFGRTISLIKNHTVSYTLRADDQDQSPSTSTTSQDNNKEPSGGSPTRSKQEDDSIDPSQEELTEAATSSGLSGEPNTPVIDKEISSPKTDEKEDPSETSESPEKTLKKPDKILPCPRCNSMDTKFCYYNNYNVNQPRHFCKNCQRYWTAGGSMRNVPVGSGRRKNKNASASNYRHIMVSEALQAGRTDAGIICPTMKANGAVLRFGSDRPLCESIASSLNLVEKSQNCIRNGFHVAEERTSVSVGGREYGNDHPNVSSTTSTNSTEKGSNGESVPNNYQSHPPQVPCFPAPPWSSPWNSAQSGSPMPPPAFGPSGFPVSFFPPPPYWGCAVPSPWNVQWITQSPPDQFALSTSPSSPTLGKHSRDGDMLNLSKLKEGPLEGKETQRIVLVPKTLRIDDPSEAAKSSIWSTLGIKNETADSISDAGLFKTFRSKGREKDHMAQSSLVLQANPAALSRSLNFHETA